MRMPSPLPNTMIDAPRMAPLPVVPPEVWAFAEQHGVRAYLYPLLELVRRLFPQAPLTVLLEDDPEIANDWHIVFEADRHGLDVSQLVAAQRRWSQEIF